MSYYSPSYYTDPPERSYPSGIEDLMGTTWVCYDEDGDLCLYGEVTDFDTWEDAEYDDEGYPCRYGGVTVSMETYNPDGTRTRTWDQSINPDDLNEGTSEYEWKPLDRATFRAALEAALKV